MDPAGRVHLSSRGRRHPVQAERKRQHVAGDPDHRIPVRIQLRCQFGAIPRRLQGLLGIRNFGLNYGCLFAAFGMAGLTMPWLNGLIRDRTGSSDLSYIIIIALMLVAAVLAVVSRYLGAPHKHAATKAVATQEGG